MKAMKIQLWNSTLTITDSQRKTLESYILDWLAKCPKEREAVSYLVQNIRIDTKLSFPTRYNDAMRVFEALGFKIEQPPAKNGGIGRACYVTL